MAMKQRGVAASRRCGGHDGEVCEWQAAIDVADVRHRLASINPARIQDAANSMVHDAAREPSGASRSRRRL